MNKIIAPIIITILISGIIALYAFGILYSVMSIIPFPFVIIIALGFITLLLALIYTLIKRIKEIKEEDEDDISKY